MPRVHGLEHVGSLSAAALADDDPVGTHSKRVDDEVADGDLAHAFGVHRPGFEAHDMRVFQKAQLRRILDGDDPLLVRNLAREGVEQRCLAATGSPDNRNALAGAHRPPQSQARS
jgi:hypothetical protein